MAHSSTTEMNPEGDKERAGIQSVEVGFALLDVLAQAPGPLMLRDLASAAGMSAAKAHRYLVSFQRLSLVVQDANTRYELGPATVLALGGWDAFVVFGHRPVFCRLHHPWRRGGQGATHDRGRVGLGPQTWAQRFALDSNASAGDEQRNPCARFGPRGQCLSARYFGVLCPRF